METAHASGRLDTGKLKPERALSSDQGRFEMSDQIKAGDVVQLKSGGPLMTVANVDMYGYENTLSAYCDWFIQDKSPWKKENGTFPLSSLKKVE